jgi:predicted Zn finger-like uncharacterized protein
MKFLCPSCKAKYHVADEKIAGRSLRMKCRKCEFVISLSDAPPAPPTLAPTDGELVPRLPAPPLTPQLLGGSAPPWTSPQQVAQLRAAANLAPVLRAPVAHGATAIAMTAPAANAVPATEVIGHVTPASDGLPAVAAEEWFVAIHGKPSGPMRLSELRKRAGAGEVTLESMVWRDGDDDWKKLSSLPELVAIVEEQLSNVRAAATPPALPALAAAAAGEPESRRFDHAAEDLAAAGLARRRLPLAAWAALVVAMLLGLTIGFVVFSGQTRVAPVASVAPAPPTAQATQLATASVEEVPATPGAEPSSAVPSATPGALAARSVAAASGKPGAAGSKDLKAGAEQPVAAAALPDAALSSATIEGTVARYKASVKRSCWQPALEARAADAPTSARVNVSLTIAPSGSVQSVTTSGDPKGYPGLANCIAGRVRGWQFPASGGSTPVNVPFVFAGQKEPL